MNREFVKPLLEWYWENKRDLPWRDKNNAYYTWVSEIMLQQTRVEAVKPYFLRFISELPDIHALAECPEEKLLKLWEGLGYYNRVRNLQYAARQIEKQYGGEIPASHEELLKLKGIGSYTAGAIASIAYGIPVSAVDGNVLRVISRLTESYEDIMLQSVRKNMEKQIEEIIPEKSAGDFNQALMELGAMICVPNGEAKCTECPVRQCCKACENHTQNNLPVKKKKQQRKIEERTVFIIQDGAYTMIRKRPNKGLLAGLYELPNITGHLNREQALKIVEDMQLEPLYIEEMEPAKHIFSHIEWHMIAYRVRVSSLTSPENADMLFVEKKQSKEKYAIPSAFSAYIKYMKEESI
ncbi:MAG: A/G-specific adenine glycosylase [Eubacteriales bacterium]|nr:A/G-specific adenine glycosylase [Eubacteriales bacterium]